MDIAAAGTRRRFVVGGLATVAAVGLSGCGGGGSGIVSIPGNGGNNSAAAAGPPLLTAEADAWEAMVGSSFSIAAESGQTMAVLAGIQRMAADANRPAALARHTGFKALFEITNSVLPQGQKVYRMGHATRGGFDLLLGQVSLVQGKNVISAILN